MKRILFVILFVAILLSFFCLRVFFLKNDYKLGSITYRLTSSTTMELFNDGQFLQIIEPEKYFFTNSENKNQVGQIPFINLNDKNEIGGLEIDSLISNDVDVNFDGLKDLKILTGIGYMGVNLCYDFYVFDNELRKFKAVEELRGFCNPTINAKDMTISMSAKSGPGYYLTIVKFENGKFNVIEKDKSLTE